MFKLCIAIAVIGCVATLSEGQTFNRRQAALLSPYQQQQFRVPNLQRTRYQTNFYSRFSPIFLPQRTLKNNGQARIITQHKDARPDGAYEYIYETENGIRGQERNLPKSLRSGETSANAEGAYSYTSPEGLKVFVVYQSDEDGFHPVLSYGGNGAGQFINNPDPSSVIINKKPVA